MCISARSRSNYIRIFSLILACIFSVICLSSCALNGNLRTVGTVGGYEVPYEEFYFLAESYKSNLEDKYGAYDELDDQTKKAFDEELENLVYSNIITNYAILSLCADEGLTLDNEEINDRVDENIEKMILSNFNGDDGLYKESMELYGLTDHYVRFLTSVDFLYSDLMVKLVEESVSDIDDSMIKEIAKSDFARTWHIMIFNNEGESVEENRAKAEEALSKLRDGSKSMYELIGSKYNEDISITSLDGIHFAKGTKNEVYEEVAFGLNEGEYSDVFEIVTANADGDNLNAFCIMQRLAIEDNYVDENLSWFRQEYISSKMSVMLEQKKTELSFVPNAYGETLMPSSLDKAIDLTLTVIIVTCVLLVAIVVVVLLVTNKRKKKQLSIAKSSKADKK